MLPIRTILHPTDFSMHSEHAYRLACSLARDHGARLVVMHVVSGLIPGEVMRDLALLKPCSCHGCQEHDGVC